MSKYIDKDKLLIHLMDLELDHVQTKDGDELWQIVSDFPETTPSYRDCKDFAFMLIMAVCLFANTMVLIWK